MTRRIAFLLLAGVLGFVLAACGGNGESESTTTVETTTEAMTTAEGTTTGAMGTTEGDVAAGKTVFVSTGCGTCHTLSAAGTSGTIGPNLDDELVSAADASGESLEDYVRTSIVDPNAVVAEGYQEGVMPGTYSDQLSEQQLDDLVAFIVASVQ
ncbi:MAG TPA: cytochrome c [Gaiellaceae bacterium]|jgi:mono/diheme cytochrome c family protein